MGCCASRPGSPNPPNNQHNSSSRTITSSQPQSEAALVRPSTNNSNRSCNFHRSLPQPTPGRRGTGGRSGAGGSNEPVASPPTQSLKPPKRWNTKIGERSWTRQSLDAERTAFFDTQVTGRPEIWQAIRSALEVLWQGGDPGDTDGGLATANSIITAAEITVPVGDLTKDMFDRFGAQYKLPKHIVSDPQNLAPSPPPEPEDSGEGVQEEGESDEVDEDELLRRREEKGKAVVNEAEQLDVKVRFSDGQPDHVTRVGQGDSVRLVVRQIAEEIGLQAPKRIRLNCRGRIFEEGRSLKAQGWNGEDVIIGLVFEQ